MHGKFFMYSLVLGLAAALPTKNLKTLRTRRNSASTFKSGLGIYDGTATTIARHNYLVSLLEDDAFYCAGVIVSDSYVLTLADCAYDLSASDITVVAGSSDGSNGTSYDVKKIITHPSYDDELNYNFALLKLKTTITFGDDAGAVTLPSADPKNGASLVATGWGDTSAVGSMGSATLYQGTMKYMTESNCEAYYSDYDVNFDSTIACAYNKGKVTMCDNDFGDPFTKDKVLYGLMAAGGSSDFCTCSAIPVIIAEVYSVIEWINEYI